MDRSGSLTGELKSEGEREREGKGKEERKRWNGKRQVSSYESRTYFRSAKCKQNDSPVMHRGIWRKSSSCDDWFQWYQPTLALYQPERHIYYPRPLRLEQMLRCRRPIRTTTQISRWILCSISTVLQNCSVLYWGSWVCKLDARSW